MSRTRLVVSAALTAGMLGAMITAPVASATPKCIDTAPLTTLCQTNGSAQLTTSPQIIYNNVYPYGGYGWGGFGIGLGG